MLIFVIYTLVKRLGTSQYLGMSILHYTTVYHPSTMFMATDISSSCNLFHIYAN